MWLYTKPSTMMNPAVSVNCFCPTSNVLHRTSNEIGASGVSQTHVLQPLCEPSDGPTNNGVMWDHLQLRWGFVKKSRPSKMDASVLLPAGIPMLTLTHVQFSQEKWWKKKHLHQGHRRFGSKYFPVSFPDYKCKLPKSNVVNPIRNHPHYQKCATKSSPMVYGRCIETNKISLLGIAGFISEMGAYKRITRMLRMLHNPPGISR